MSLILPDFTALLDYYKGVVVAALGTEEQPYGGTSFIQPGGVVAWDSCDCQGQAWSRFVQAVPIYDTPKANGIPCVVRWDVTLAIGVIKCASSVQGRVMPTAEQINDGGVVFGDDLTMLMHAIECDPKKYRLVSAAPLGPEGGCAGSEVQFIVRVAPCCR